MDLDDINPQAVNVKLARLPDPITVLPPSFHDERLLSEEYTPKELNEMFTTYDDIPGLMKIVFRMLDYRSKKMLNEAVIVDINEDGDEIELEAKPFEKLAYLISGSVELAKIIQAVVKARGLSLPKDYEEMQKKTPKKTRKTSSHGRKSTT